MAREIRSYWDTHFLMEYLTFNQIPRGLRIKKFPTSELFDEDLKKEGTDTLNACSFKLMDILIKSNKKTADKIQGEMLPKQTDLTALQTHVEFPDLNGHLTPKWTNLRDR